MSDNKIDIIKWNTLGTGVKQLEKIGFDKEAIKDLMYKTLERKKLNTEKNKDKLFYELNKIFYEENYIQKELWEEEIGYEKNNNF